MEAVEIDSDEQIPYAPTCYKYKHVNVQKSTQINIYHASTFCHTAAREDLNREYENVRYSLCCELIALTVITSWEKLVT